MRIINLMENTEGTQGCVYQHGLSCYVETERHKLLVDAGPSADFMENAKRLGIDLGKVDTLVLSHGHYDHSGGILPFAKINPNALIYLQALATGEYYAYDGAELGYRFIGIDPGIAKLPQARLLNGDERIDEELSLFVMDQNQWPVPSTNKRILEKVGGEYVRDAFLHEQVLVVRSEGKNLVFSGCAHNGVLNVMDTFLRKYQAEPDVLVSGFHLMKKTEYREDQLDEIDEIARSLMKYERTKFYTCHCTGIPAYERMKAIMGERLTYVHAGEEIKVLE